MNAQNTALVERAPVDVIKSLVARKSDEFKSVLPAHITVEKFQRTIATAALANPQLFQCDRQSLLMAAMKSAQDGLLPDGREAALVPFKNRVKLDNGQFGDSWEVQYLPMVYGLRKKILQSGDVISIETGVVYRAEVESGNFLYEIGIDPPIRYRPKLDLTAEETTDDQIVVAFSIARLRNPHEGGEPYWSVKVLRRFQIDEIRQTSQTGAVGRVVKFGANKGKPIEPKGPWVDWFPAMAEKTALRQHSKSLPMSGDILDTFDRDDEEERRAQGAARLLETEPDEPRRLPTASELDAQAGEGESIDPKTGEITQRDNRGMTDVDEETARQLDAGNDALLDEAAAKLEKMVKEFAAAKSDAEIAAIHERYSQWISDIEEPFPELHNRAMAAIPLYSEEGPAQAQRGEASNGTDETEADDAPAWTAMIEQTRTGIAAAKTLTYLKTVMAEFEKHLAVLPDDVVKDIDALASAKRRDLQPKKEA